MSDTSIWYVGINGQQQGPLGTQQVIDQIRSGLIGQTAYVYGQGLAAWTPIVQVPAFAQAFHAAPPAPPPPPPGPAPTMADVIDYEILGNEMQFVEITLDPGEAAVAEAGAFFYMEPGIEEGVAAVKGGIVAGREELLNAGPCEFGADEDIARIILTVMRFDPGIRSAASLRCSGAVFRVMERLLLDCRSFEQGKAPSGISTMDWGIASCCKEGIPDVCYPNQDGKESVFIILGEDPVDVSNNIIMISNRILNIEL